MELWQWIVAIPLGIFSVYMIVTGIEQIIEDKVIEFIVKRR